MRAIACSREEEVVAPSIEKDGELLVTTERESGIVLRPTKVSRFYADLERNVGGSTCLLTSSSICSVDWRRHRLLLVMFRVKSGWLALARDKGCEGFRAAAAAAAASNQNTNILSIAFAIRCLAISSMPVRCASFCNSINGSLGDNVAAVFVCG